MTANDDLDGVTTLRWFHHGMHKHLRRVYGNGNDRSEYSDISVGSKSADSDDGDFRDCYNADMSMFTD